jgi:hypothetical protein
MPRDTTVKSGTPSKNAENQDAAILTQSQPSTSEELEARSGRTRTATKETAEQRRHDPDTADQPMTKSERDRGLQPAAGPTGVTDGDD